MKHVMVINMGLKSIRCIIFNEAGEKISNTSVAINTAINQERVEQDPMQWWEKAKQIIKKSVEECNNIHIDYITVTASASCLVCIDEAGKPLCRAVMVSDKRAEEEAREIQNMQEFVTIRKETGLEMSSSLMLAKILWTKHHMEEVYEKTAYYMTPNDYMIYCLSGACKTDYYNAIKYHYNMETKQYPKTILHKIGIREDKLPEVVDPGTIIGTIRIELIKELGLTSTTQVVVTSYDAICSFVGSGATKAGEASDVSGTVTVFRTLAKTENLKKSSKVYAVPFYEGETAIVGGSNNLGGGLIEWVKQCYYQNETYPYEIMEKEAGESTVSAKGLVFLPYLLGERAPLWDDNARGVFFGIERMHTRKDMTRAVFESTGFIDMDMILAIEETGAHIDSVRISGGLARVNLISQIKADILGRDILVLSEFETTATGAAMMTLVGAKRFDTVKQAADAFVSVRMIIKPNMRNHVKYQQWYRLYKDTYSSMAEIFIKRKQTLRQIYDDKEVQIENL